MCVLDGANTWSFIVPGTNLLRGPHNWFVDGDCSGNLYLGQRIGDEGVLIGRHFLWRFRCSMSSHHRERGSHSDDSGGAADFVPPRTPRSSGYDFLYTYGLCCYMLYVYYMLYACYISSSDPSSVRSGSV
jgi:hypothetical protein